MSDSPHSLSERSHPYLPGLWLAAGFLGLASLAFLLRPAGVTSDTILEKAAMERWDRLQKLSSEQEKEAASYGWIDKEKGIARIPVDKAMELTARKLRAEDPRPAYPITTIAPSAITAAGYPLYPEVPVDAGAMAAAQAADGGIPGGVVKFSSSDPKVASISNGTVKVIGPGTATITAERTKTNTPGSRATTTNTPVKK